MAEGCHRAPYKILLRACKRILSGVGKRIRFGAGKRILAEAMIRSRSSPLTTSKPCDTARDQFGREELS